METNKTNLKNYLKNPPGYILITGKMLEELPDIIKLITCIISG